MEFPTVCMMTSVHCGNDIRIYHKEAKTLQRAGYHVNVLCTDRQGKDENGVCFWAVQVPKSRCERMVSAWRIMAERALALGCTIYHIHDPELLPAAFWLKKHGKTVIYDAHEDTPVQIRSKPYWNAAARGAASAFVQVLETKAGQKLDQVFAATASIAARYPNGVAIENYPFLEEFKPSALKPYRQRLLPLCYAGALTERRGLYTMLEAAKQAQEKLHLAGVFETPCLYQQFLQWNARGQAVWHGQLDRREVVSLLGNSRVGLLLLDETPAYRRSYPIKLFEYMLAATPMVLSDFPLWRELTGRENAVFVPPGNSKKAAEAAAYLLAHPDEAEQMGAAMQQRARERFLFPEKRLLDQYFRLWRKER